MVRFASGAWLTLTMTQLDPTPGRKWLEIIGTEGTYAFDHERWWLIQQKGEELITTEGRNPETEWWRFYQNVARHLVKGKKLVISAEWARRPIHIIDLACRSAQKGKALKAKYK